MPASIRRIVLLIAFLPFVLLPGLVRGAVVVPVTLADMSRDAELIVRGRVVSIEFRRAGPSNDVHTFVTLDPLVVDYGSHSQATLTLVFWGGELDGARYELSGMPRFQEGEEVLLFLYGNGVYVNPIVGWSQGRFDVERDPATGSEYLVDALGRAVMGVEGGALQLGEPSAVGAPLQRASARDEAPPPMRLDDFVAEIGRLRDAAGAK
jgi:hypothetical protein